jgi:hypothetical protein
VITFLWSVSDSLVDHPLADPNVCVELCSQCPIVHGVGCSLVYLGISGGGCYFPFANWGRYYGD